MADRNAYIDYELIAKYMAGEAVPEEQLKVEDWVATSEENRRSFAKLQALWEQTGRIIPHEELDVDIDRAWGRFNKKINFDIEPAKKRDAKVRNFFFYASRIAAVLVLAVGFYLIYKNITANPEKIVALSAAKKPVIDTLSDGSVVSLNVHSRAFYSSDFNKEKRSLILKGEAFFDVASNPEKPFVIETEGLVITVLGTSFYVKAYDSLPEIAIGVEEGRVRVKQESSGHEVLLKNGESLAINRSSKEFKPQPFDPNNLYWKSKTLIFKNDGLSNVFQTLETSYGIDIDVKNEQIFACRFTAKFHNEDIHNIFEIINTTFNLTTTHEDNRYLISGGGCD